MSHSPSSTRNSLNSLLRAIFAATLFPLFFFAFVQIAQAQTQKLKTYKIDMRFNTEKLPLPKDPTPEKVNAYYSFTNDLSHNTHFAETAVLDFGVKKIRLHLLGAIHYSKNYQNAGYLQEAEFIQNSLRTFDPHLDPTHHSIFIEQGEPSMPGGFAEQMFSLFEKMGPDFNQSARLNAHLNNTVLNQTPGDSRENNFSTVTQQWINQNGTVKNFDLRESWTKEAVAFLLKNTDRFFAMNFLYFSLESILHPDQLKLLLNSQFPESFPDDDLNCALSPLGQGYLAKWLDQNHIWFDLVRERYMKQFLLENAHDGDIVITHPAHLRSLLDTEYGTQLKP